MAGDPLSPTIARFLRMRAHDKDRTFPAIAAEAARLFGDTAPSPDQVAASICEYLPRVRTLNRMRRDIAVAGWIQEHAWHSTLTAMRAGCEKRFGAARTPSRSALGRYLRRIGRTGQVVSRGFAPAIAAFIDRAAPSLTVAEISTICRRRFGARHNFREGRISRYLKKRGITSAGRASVFVQDDELATWFRAAATTLTLDGLRAAAVRQFGAGRVPSRSAIHRFLMRLGTVRPRHATNYRPEVIAWLYRNEDAHSLSSLSTACAAEFGSAAPSRSAIHRLLTARHRLAR